MEAAGTGNDDEGERRWDLSAYDGIEVEVGTGDGKIYTLILKDGEAPGKREDGRDKAGVNWEVDFKVGGAEGADDVTNVWVPWGDFTATFRGKGKKDAGELQKTHVRKIGLMMRRLVQKRRGEEGSGSNLTPARFCVKLTDYGQLFWEAGGRLWRRAEVHVCAEG